MLYKVISDEWTGMPLYLFVLKNIFIYILDCHSTLIATEGNITSRACNDDLQSWLNCDWLVILPKLSSVHLNFLDFDLPPADFGHCKQGFLILGTFDTKGKYCTDSRFLTLCAEYLIPQFNRFESNCRNIKSRMPKFYDSFI